MNKNAKLYCVMDETGRPYENNECPFPRTKDDDKIMQRILEKNGLKIDERSFYDCNNAVITYRNETHTDNDIDQLRADINANSAE